MIGEIYRFQQRLCYLLLKKHRTRKQCVPLVQRFLKALQDLSHAKSGEGTTFQVFLPASGDAGAAQLPHLAEPQDTTADSETILVIDDEEVVRSTADTAQRRLGYNVITAADGARGIELLRAHSQSVRLVLLDLSMPGVSGEETMREIRKIRPDVPVVLSSGYSEAYALRRFEDQQIAGLFAEALHRKGTGIEGQRSNWARRESCRPVKGSSVARSCEGSRRSTWNRASRSKPSIRRDTAKCDRGIRGYKTFCVNAVFLQNRRTTWTRIRKIRQKKSYWTSCSGSC